MSDVEWVTPGSGPAGASSRPPGDGSPASVPGRAAPRPLLLRPLSVVELLDVGFAIIRARPAVVLMSSAVFVVPLALVTGFLQRDLLDGQSFLDVLSDPTLYSADDASGFDATAVDLVGGSVVQALVGAAVAVLIAGWYVDMELDIVTLLGRLVRRAPVILAAWAVAHLMMVVGLVVFAVGALLVAVHLVVVAPVVAVENLGPIRALRRSRRLVRGRFWSVAWFFVLSGLMGSLVETVLGALPTGLGLVMGLDLGWIAVAVGAMVGGTVATAFVGAATVALYFDMRVRTEGLDIELRMSDAFSPDP
ncbi:MAG: hypothetical protein ACE5GB_14940 [Acidimicrobiales bacterium]